MSKDTDQTVHEFWSTQPVPQSTHEPVVLAGPIQKPKTVDEVPVEPYPIASTFEWWTPDPQKPEDLQCIYELLRDNYVEDQGSFFRFNYSPDFLRWALSPPGYVPDWHVAVRMKSTKKMLAFISGIPLTMRMGTPKDLLEASTEAATARGETLETYDAPRRICEINFLCVHKQLRTKRLAPILIMEVTRRVNRHNIWQAVYTSGTVIPTPFSRALYFHRKLNPEKLVAIQFSSIPTYFKRFQNPMAMLKRFYALPSEVKTKGLRPMTAADIPRVAELLHACLQKYDVAPVFDEEEVAHYLLPKEGVLYSYVVDRGDGVSDFASFYSLPSTVIGNSLYSQLEAAYLHYYAVNTVPLTQLMTDLLIIARSKSFDVCNMVGILENTTFVEDLRFGVGDGKLHYYFYNWSYPHREGDRIGLVML